LETGSERPFISRFYPLCNNIARFHLVIPIMDERLLDILVCPVTKAPLEWRPEQQELICRASRLAYPVRDGIPVMLEDEARPVTDEELKQR